MRAVQSAILKHVLPGLALLTLGAPAFAATSVETHGKLQVKGNLIVDKNGKTVTLRGMSLYWSQWLPKFWNASAIKWMRDDWKIDVIRAAMAVDSGGYLTNPATEEAKVYTAIDAAIANGVYVIVDWHAHDPHQAEAQAFFAKVAKKYGNTPNIIWETWNEPLSNYSWSGVIKPYHEAVIRSIRQYSSNLVVAGTRSWSQEVDEATATPLADANTAYTLHFYAATHKEWLRVKTSTARARNKAIFVTEYGTTAANGGAPIDEAETNAWFGYLDANHISYVNWSVADISEASAALKPGASQNGGWPASQISTSGTLVRNHLVAKAGRN